MVSMNTTITDQAAISTRPDTAQGASPTDRPAISKRLLSLDTYRGLIMVSLAFTGFGLAGTALNHLKLSPDSGFWKFAHGQFEHAEWVGCSYWDMIQPSFMFMVGVSMAYSYAKRKERGDSELSMLGHALWRSVVLVFLGIFLISNGSKSTSWSLMNVLSQIGLGYPFLFLLWNRSFRTQALTAAALLAGTWLLFTAYPFVAQNGIDARQGAPEIGISTEWAQTHLQGIPPAWQKNNNVGHAVDRWLLNLLPRNDRFEFSSGGYQTINFIPSLATMIFGLMAGRLLRSATPDRRKLTLLLVAGFCGLAAGQLMHWLGICPLVKRIWTPSWALFSTGWCLLILAGLFGLVDVLQYRRWTFPLIVVGMNSIAIYSMGMLLKGWVRETLKTHFGADIFLMLGPLYEPMVRFTLTGLVFWMICWWMYRRKIFLRI